MEFREFLKCVSKKYSNPYIKELDVLFSQYLDKTNFPTPNAKPSIELDTKEKKYTVINIDTITIWNEFIKSVYNTKEIHAYLEKNDGLKSKFSKMLSQYDDKVCKCRALNNLDEFDEETNERLAECLRDLIKKSFLNLIEGCQRGLNSENVSSYDKKLYAEFSNILEDYIVRLGLQKIDVKVGQSTRGENAELIDIIGTIKAPKESMKYTIAKVESSGYKVWFIDEHDEENYFAIEPKVIVYA